jgi:hypothetical protein
MKRSLRILHTEAAKGMGGQEIYIFRHMQAMRARPRRLAAVPARGTAGAAGAR